MPTIQEILIEANLSTDQVEQIAAVVTESTGAARATLRAAHLAEIAEKDAAIGDLMRGLVEAKQPSEATVNAILKKIATTFKISNGAAHAIFLGGSTSDLTAALESLEKQGFDSAYTDFSDNAEFFAKAKVSKADFDMLVTASMDDMDESTRIDVKVNESSLTLSKRGGFRVVLAEANGKTRTARLDANVLAEVAKKMKAKKMSEADGDEELDAVEVDEALASKVLGESLVYMAESVVVKPRRITAKKGEGAAVGIDVDTTGALAFTVTDEEGSSMIELTKPDSAAVRKWFSTIQESVRPAVDADTMEEMRAEAIQEAAVLLEAAMADVAPRLREMRAYSEVKGRLERIQEALVTSGVFSAPLAESALNESKAAVEQENAALRAEVAQFKEVALKGEFSSLFEAATKDLAQTTREKVSKLVEAAKPTSVKEYGELLEAAVQASKPAVNPQPSSTVLAEAKPATAMDKYVRML